jgi:hypothetical protein
MADVVANSLSHGEHSDAVSITIVSTALRAVEQLK